MMKPWGQFVLLELETQEVEEIKTDTGLFLPSEATDYDPTKAVVEATVLATGHEVFAVSAGDKVIVASGLKMIPVPNYVETPEGYEVGLSATQNIIAILGGIAWQGGPGDRGSGCHEIIETDRFVTA